MYRVIDDTKEKNTKPFQMRIGLVFRIKSKEYFMGLSVSHIERPYIDSGVEVEKQHFKQNKAVNIQ